MNRIILYFATIGLLSTIDLGAAVVLDRCQIAQELTSRGVSQYDLPSWVCLVQIESGGNTKAVRGPGRDGSRDYGLFLVSDKWWCGNGRNTTDGNQCGVACEDLITDNPGPAIECAKKIMYIYQNGFSAWHKFAKECEGKLPNLKSCSVFEYEDLDDVYK